MKVKQKHSFDRSDIMLCVCLASSVAIMAISHFVDFSSLLPFQPSERGGAAKHQAIQEAVDRKRDQLANQVLDAKGMADMNLKAMLNDGDSAKFKDVFVSRLPGGNLMVCGKVNAKNALGAYTGFKRFIASPNPSAPSIIQDDASGLTDAQFQQAYSMACSNVVERF